MPARPQLPTPNQTESSNAADVSRSERQKDVSRSERQKDVSRSERQKDAARNERQKAVFLREVQRIRREEVSAAVEASKRILKESRKLCECVRVGNRHKNTG